MIIDTGRTTRDAAGRLRDAGVSTVFRYYARQTRLPEKRLTRPEAEALISAGIAIGAVFQNAGDSGDCFSAALGEADGACARDHATAEIGQPAGSAIYFAVDYDASDADIAARILPHFEAVRREIAGAGNRPGYRLGAYGTGRVCEALHKAGLADLTWLSNKPGDVAFDAWTLRQDPPDSLCGLPVDRSHPGEGIADFGAFARLDVPIAGPG